MKYSHSLLIAFTLIGFTATASGASLSDQGLYYEFNESASPADDLSGNGRDGTWNNIDPGVPGTEFNDQLAYLFDGSTSVVNASYNPPLTEYGISAWASLNSSSVNDGNHDIVATDSGQFIIREQGGNWRFYHRDGSNSWVLITETSVQNADSFIHLGMSWNGSHITTYRNGSSLETQSMSGIDDNDPDGLYVGARGDADSRYFDGKIDTIRYFEAGLTDSEMQNLFTCNSVVSCNENPNFNSSSISPDPPLVGENASFGAEVYDSDGNISYTNLTVEFNGSTVVSDEKRTGESPEWNEIYYLDEDGAWLNATFETVDNDGAVTEESLNRFVPEHPQVASMECEVNSTEWRNCGNGVSFGEMISSLRSDVRDPDGMEYVNFTLVDEYDNNIRIDNKNYTEENGTYHILLDVDEEVNDSGTWNVSVKAKDPNSNEVAYEDREWNVSWGELDVYMERPSRDIQVKQGNTFNMTGVVRCVSGECASETDGEGGGPEKVEVWADPKPADSNTGSQKIFEHRGHVAAGDEFELEGGMGATVNRGTEDESEGISDLFTRISSLIFGI